MKSCANTHILQIKNFSMISFWAKLRKLLYFHVANVMQGVFSWKRVFSWKTNFGPPESGSSANPSSREHFMSYQWKKSSRSEGCVHEIRDFCRAEFEGKSLPFIEKPARRDVFNAHRPRNMNLCLFLYLNLYPSWMRI